MRFDNVVFENRRNVRTQLERVGKRYEQRRARTNIKDDGYYRRHKHSKAHDFQITDTEDKRVHTACHKAQNIQRFRIAKYP